MFVLKQGQIEDQGTFDSLKKKQVNFLEILARNEETNESPKTATTPRDTTPESASSNLASNTTSSNDIENAEEAEPEETEELLAKGSVSKSLYWKYIRSGASIMVIVVSLLFLVLGQIGSSGCDYWVSYW